VAAASESESVSAIAEGSEPAVATTRPARGQARNGNGSNGHASDSAAMFESTAAVSVMSAHLSEMMGDAPFCDVCGHITVRNGACYKCLNCGNSLGCS
jgi:ribonucleoside-diphosphate reductase alpha chain